MKGYLAEAGASYADVVKTIERTVASLLAAIDSRGDGWAGMPASTPWRHKTREETAVVLAPATDVCTRVGALAALQA